MPKLDLYAIPQDNRTGYPPEYADVVQGRLYRRLAPVAGLSDFGASHVVLRPGAWSAHRHWHEGEDELVVMLAGEAVLVEEDGETILRPGDIAAFAKGVANGHVLQNRSEADCVYLAIGRPSDSDCHYPDIDLHLFDGTRFAHRDGTPFE